MFTTKLLQAPQRGDPRIGLDPLKSMVLGGSRSPSRPSQRLALNLQKHGRLWTLPGASKALAASKSFESPNSDEGESYRDAGPVEGQRYPFGNPTPNQRLPRPFHILVLVKGESCRDAGPVEGQRFPFGNPTPNQPPPTTFSQPSLGQGRVVSGRWPGRGAALTPTALCRCFRAGKGCQTPSKKSKGNGTPTVTQTNGPPPRPSHNLVLVQGESYRDAFPVEGQRYPCGNPNCFVSMVFVLANEGRRQGMPNALKEARRDTGPVGGQRYPYGNPNQSVRHMPDAFREGR